MSTIWNGTGSLGCPWWRTLAEQEAGLFSFDRGYHLLVIWLTCISSVKLAARKAAGEGLRSMLGGPDQSPEEEKYSEVLAKIGEAHGLESVTAVALACLFILVSARATETDLVIVQTSFPRPR